MRVVAWDSWAFLETALGYSRRGEVAHLWAQTDVVVTSRDVVAETFNFITGRTRSDRHAREWLAAAANSRVRIVDAPLDEVRGYVEAHPESPRSSWTDLSLAFVAEQAGTREVATHDSGFHALGLRPVFSERR